MVKTLSKLVKSVTSKGNNRNCVHMVYELPSRSKRRLKRRQPFCLRATLENFSTFCRQTSLHGWQYIAQKNSSSAKHMFWAIVVSLSMATAALFLYNNTMDYLNATVSSFKNYFSCYSIH